MFRERDLLLLLVNICEGIPTAKASTALLLYRKAEQFFGELARFGRDFIDEHLSEVIPSEEEESATTE
jgi:hypothetical protein